MTSRTRKLTVHQQAVLIQVLLSFPEQRVAIQYFPSAGDAPAYAQDFQTIFKAVGWSVNDMKVAERSTGQTTGLALVVSQDRCLPPSAEAFRDALRIYGIEVETVLHPDGNVAAGSFVLSVSTEVSED